MRAFRRVCLAGVCVLASGCATLNSHTNVPLPKQEQPTGRATLLIDEGVSYAGELLVIHAWFRAGTQEFASFAALRA